MIQPILNSRNFVACLLGAATGMVLYFKLQSSGENVFLQVMPLRVPLVQRRALLLLQPLVHDSLHCLLDSALRAVYIFLASLSTTESVQANCLLILTRANATLYFLWSARFTTSASLLLRRAGTLQRHGNRRRNRYRKDEVLRMPILLPVSPASNRVRASSRCSRPLQVRGILAMLIPAIRAIRSPYVSHT